MCRVTLHTSCITQGITGLWGGAWQRDMGRHHSPFFLLSAAEQFLVHRAAAHRTQQITVIIVISEHFESASLLILSCWLSIAIIADPHHIRECRDAAVGRGLGGECSCPRCFRLDCVLPRGRCWEKAQKIGVCSGIMGVGPKATCSQNAAPKGCCSS